MGDTHYCQQLVTSWEALSKPIFGEQHENRNPKNWQLHLNKIQERLTPNGHEFASPPTWLQMTLIIIMQTQMIMALNFI